MRTMIARSLRAVTTPAVASEDKCPTCKGNFTTCGCGQYPKPVITSVGVARTVRAGLYDDMDDMTKDDDQRGFERDETDEAASRLVSHRFRSGQDTSPPEPMPKREPGETIPPLLRPRRRVRAVRTTVVREVAA
ncbi:hypothetical protein ACFXKG_30695 [Streptomyces sp. NPDC059255]|uniref:hypothetical protein n=1 Tax=Streptomyces sp. NPDC059255 TaxID=3346793 RepID=UPI0036CA54AB